jgi:hypothetical protein
MPWRIFGKKKAPASSAEAFMEPILTGQDYFFALQLQPHPQPEAFSSFLAMQSLPPQSAHFLGLHLPSLVAPHFSHLNIAMVSPPISCQTVIVCKPKRPSCRMFCVKPRPTSVGALPAPCPAVFRDNFLAWSQQVHYSFPVNADSSARIQLDHLIIIPNIM